MAANRVSVEDFAKAIGVLRKFGWVLVNMTDGEQQLREVRRAGESARLQTKGHARELLEEFARGVLGKGTGHAS
jgi:hypothetical protein